VKGVRASRVAAANNPRELPFTGFPAWAIALIGAAMLSGGLLMRRVSH
jgi:LPXTG-motif cell wall-anchored protein